MKKLALVLILAGFSCLYTLYAEDEDTAPPPYHVYTNALGFQYGELSGTGISYFHQLGFLGLHVAAGGYYNPDSGTRADFSVGTEAHFFVFGANYKKIVSGQLYLFLGLNYRGRVEDLYDVAPDGTEKIASPNSYYGTYSAGIGVGVELVLFEHYSIPMELGYAVSTRGFDPDSWGESMKLFVVPQIGLRYRF